MISISYFPMLWCDTYHFPGFIGLPPVCRRYADGVIPGPPVQSVSQPVAAIDRSSVISTPSVAIMVS